jgi:hypothetical protein
MISQLKAEKPKLMVASTLWRISALPARDKIFPNLRRGALITKALPVEGAARR